MAPDDLTAVAPPHGSAGIVLDASCVRGTPRSVLRVLQHRGFLIHVSGLALDELAVHLAPSSVAASTENGHRKLLSRMSFLSELLGGVPSMAPTHSPLVDKLGGEIIGLGVVPYGAWLEKMQSTWAELAGDGQLSQETADLVERMKEYVEGTGKDFVVSSEGIAAFGEPTPQERAVAARLPMAMFSVIDRIRLPDKIAAPDRFDAFMRVLDLHCEGAHARSVHRQAAQTPNDAIDLNLLQHLADGLVVVTRDYGLIEAVDACRTIQAPWVRTAGELVLGMAPLGYPFEDNARKAALHHKPRTRAYLRRTDEEGEAIARVAEREVPGVEPQ